MIGKESLERVASNSYYSEPNATRENATRSQLSLVSAQPVPGYLVLNDGNHSERGVDLLVLSQASHNANQQDAPERVAGINAIENAILSS